MAARHVELGPGLCCGAASAAFCCPARLPWRLGLAPRPLQGTALPPSSVELEAFGIPTVPPRARSTGRLRLQLERADRRGVHWRVKQQPQPAGSADRVAAMQGELQLLELAARLRERLAEQNEALVLLEVEERALSRRLREALKNRA